MAKGLALLFAEKDLERIIWKTVVWAIGRSRDKKEGGCLPPGAGGRRMEMLVPTAEGSELEAFFCSTWDLLRNEPPHKDCRCQRGPGHHKKRHRTN